MTWVQVIEPEVRLGNLPAGSGCGIPPFGAGYQGVTFSLQVDPGAEALVSADEANGWVELTLSLEAANQDRKLETETFLFRQAVVADRQIFNFSTDFPDGTKGCSAPAENSGNPCSVESDCDSSPGAGDGECGIVLEVLRDLNRDGLIGDDVDLDNIPDILDGAIDAVRERIVFDPMPNISVTDIASAVCNRIPC